MKNIFSASNPPASTTLVKTTKSRQEVFDIVIKSLAKRNVVAAVKGDKLAGSFKAGLVAGSFEISISERSGGFSIDRMVKFKFAAAYYVILFLMIFFGVGLIFLFCIGILVLIIGSIMLGAAGGAQCKAAAKIFEDAMENTKQECEM